MDFIKTSSLRALSELTFQRNWNGLIWMSRKGVITKRVKTGPDGSIEKPAAEKRMFRVGQNRIRPSEVSAKVQPSGRVRITTREAMSRGRPSHDHSAMPRTTMPREPGSKPSRPRNLSRVPRPMAPSEPGSHVPRPAEKASANASPSDHSGRPRIRPATTVPIVQRHDPIIRPIVPSDRPNAAVDPKPVLKPFHVFSRPGLTLSRL
ncbi:unnamed protein product [Microthlaspi erraticum]|uniref:Uncharacterized protein n=1 Tax=Microthlaspi erraticum TaxID=1685480 RepID=A0A6D2KME5_9BRAS|nr:unnamed protein product [Microthlaspi erraticum]